LCVAQTGLDHAVPVAAYSAPVASGAPTPPAACVTSVYSFHRFPFQPRGPPRRA
jgi:hypothetical protein